MSKSTLRRLAIQYRDEPEKLGGFLAGLFTKEVLEIALRIKEQQEKAATAIAAWENLGRSFIDYPEPGQTYGAADG